MLTVRASLSMKCCILHCYIVQSCSVHFKNQGDVKISGAHLPQLQFLHPSVHFTGRTAPCMHALAYVVVCVVYWDCYVASPCFGNRACCPTVKKGKQARQQDTDSWQGAQTNMTSTLVYLQNKTATHLKQCVIHAPGVYAVIVARGVVAACKER
jgi:hypothetical protein